MVTVAAEVLVTAPIAAHAHTNILNNSRFRIFVTLAFEALHGSCRALRQASRVAR
jgi:hypothetical protein